MKGLMVVDARMLEASGIGVYLEHILARINKFNLLALTASNSRKILSSKIRQIPFKVSVYSPLEQALLPFKVPSCDLFWSPHYNVPLLSVRARHRVVTIHDTFHLSPYSELSTIKKIYASQLMKNAVSLSDEVITVSEFSKDEILKYTRCPPSKITVIENGAGKESNVAVDATGREKYKFPQDFILFVGNVKPHKNLKILLEAYSLLDEGIQNKYRIVIVGKKDGFITGDDNLSKFLVDNSKLKDKVIFTGFVEDGDLQKIYRAASLFVFPSYYEGFGLPVLEAMTNRCPVIAANTASIPAVCGDAALYFDPFNAEELKTRIVEMLENNSLRETLKEKGLQNITRFSWDISASKHEKIFIKYLQ